MVEGLFVVAVFYYVVGLFAYLVKGISVEIPGISQSTLIALFVPVTVLSIWLIVRRVRARHAEKDDDLAG